MRVEGDIFGTLDIAISGLKASRKHMDVVTSNVVNAQTTDAGKGEPYRRLEAVFRAGEKGINGVVVAEVNEDTSDFQKILKPGHPLADEKGFVRMPNVSLPRELIQLNQATRAYEANASILRRYQKMVDASLALLR
jgi:flagellar basal-body rod protein FlgC